MVSKLMNTFKKSFFYFLEKKGTTLAAALTFYAIISIIPFIILVLSFTGLFFKSNVLVNNFLSIVSFNFGEDISEFINILIQGAKTSNMGLNSVLSFLLLLIGANALIENIKNTMHIIEDYEILMESKKKNIKRFLKNLFYNFLIIIFFSFALLGVLLFTFFLPFLSSLFPVFNNYVFSVLSYSLFFLFSFILFFLTYRYIFGKRMNTKKMLLGSFFTSAFFLLGQILIAIYFQLATGRTSGTLGTFLAILIWFYYSFIVFLYGASFTYLYSVSKKNSDSFNYEDIEQEQN